MPGFAASGCGPAPAGRPTMPACPSNAGLGATRPAAGAPASRPCRRHGQHRPTGHACRPRLDVRAGPNGKWPRHSRPRSGRTPGENFRRRAPAAPGCTPPALHQPGPSAPGTCRARPANSPTGPRPECARPSRRWPAAAPPSARSGRAPTPHSCGSACPNWRVADRLRFRPRGCSHRPRRRAARCRLACGSPARASGSRRRRGGCHPNRGRWPRRGRNARRPRPNGRRRSRESPGHGLRTRLRPGAATATPVPPPAGGSGVTGRAD